MKAYSAKRMKLSGDKIFSFLVYLFLALILAVIAFPLIYLVSASFSDPQAVISG